MHHDDSNIYDNFTTNNKDNSNSNINYNKIKYQVH